MAPLVLLLALAAFAVPPRGEVYLPVVLNLEGVGSTPSATAPPATPTATLPAGLLPTLSNPGFEEGLSGWGYASDNYTDLITDDNPYRTPYEGWWLAWMGRYPDFAAANLPGENSWLYQQVAFPGEMGPTYFGFYYSLESFENVCKVDPPRDYMDVYLGPEIGPGVAAAGDQLVGRMILCKELTTRDWVGHVWPTDLSAYAGKTLYLKILVSVNNHSPSHLFLDELFFTNSVPEK